MKTTIASTESTRKPLNDWPNDYGFDVIHEEKVPVELKVSGRIPSYVAGTLYRTGPGGYQVQTKSGQICSASHWFDGFSQVHRFQISPDPTSPRVLYNSRSIVDPLVEHIRQTGKYEGMTFGQKRDPCESYFRKAMSFFFPANLPENVGVTVTMNNPGLTPSLATESPIGGKFEDSPRTLHTATDAALYAKVDPKTLEPIEVTRQTAIHPDLTGPFSAAHPCTDPVTGDYFNYNLAFGAGGAIYRVFCSSASTGKTEILATINDAPGTYIHSFSLTENYIVFTIWSGQYAWAGLKSLWTRNVLEAIQEFDDKRKAQWYVIDRRNGKGIVATYESDPFFCFHTVNAWEEPSHSDTCQTDIIIDLAAYDNLDVLKRFYYDNIKSTGPGAIDYTMDKRPSTRANFKRFRLPDVLTGPSSPGPRKAIVDFTVPKVKSGELPTYNGKFKCKPSRYIYGVADRGLSSFMDGIIKYDTKKHEAKVWDKKGHNPGEPIFVANPDGSGEEDDGVLLSVVLDGFKEKSYLLVLDARDLKEVGRAEMECAVGFGFHGAHYAKVE